MVQYNNIKISMVMVELKNVSFGYNPNKNVIEDLSLNLEEGRFYGLLGKNGTGKTTLMKIISGILFAKEVLKSMSLSIHHFILNSIMIFLMTVSITLKLTRI